MLTEDHRRPSLALKALDLIQPGALHVSSLLLSHLIKSAHPHLRGIVWSQQDGLNASSKRPPTHSACGIG